MEQGVAEVLIGYRENPETGPIVICGLGGTFAEHYRDLAVRLAPVNQVTASAMIKEAFYRVYIGGSNFEGVADSPALANAIVSLSNLAGIRKSRIAEAEINPLIVKEHEKGVLAVDGLIVLGNAD